MLDLTQERIVVTGGAGFLGRHVQAELLALGTPRGSILIPLGIQTEKADAIRSLLSMAAKEDGIHVYTVESGESSEGFDLGSSTYAPVDLPVVALVAGSGVSLLIAAGVPLTWPRAAIVPLLLLGRDQLF